MVLSSAPTIGHMKECLVRLRQGQALARPTTLLTALDEPVRTYLCRGQDHEPGSAEQIAALTTIVQSAIDQLSDDERLCAQVDFNLQPEHRFPTLTDRQESLASLQKCASKTIRRRAARALDTLAYVLLTATVTPQNPAASSSKSTRILGEPDAMLRRFWRLLPEAHIDLVCSEIPSEERPDYASPADRNYLRYAKFADLDTLFFVRTRLAQLAPTVLVRDFAPSEHYDTHADALVVIGGPPWNAKYREFLPQLPFRFEPHPLGQDDPLVVPQLDNLTLSPRWTAHNELIEDIVVFTRLTLQSTTVFLLGGCLTLGVLGAARCLLDAKNGSANISYIGDLVGEDDFVLITEARRVGGITDVADLTIVEPLLLMARSTGQHWSVVVDNTKRFPTRHAGRAQ
ncbi:hypothetical protein J2W56_005531 [Nocardia kruczakiae]|uniref:SIR2-like protein n=1 Tax=Nocardia kruczakiae TaxID=261477 RepID=A0ABU1XMH6_9NOCA|nr:hypothetical protein [Nocardia kruczakiae]MDR7171770.1 hypothetical protein [Nocardia kruczakiae]